MKKPINLYLDEDLIKKVERLGRKKQRSISWLVNEWIQIQLNKEVKK